ncbi:substrate-binding domain-containing protein [Inquilinus sp. Marseille-Q2685]|uniref:substrate-binding domain-containing protein n=1 Tax=Inquilinus sp. Marseille-Q2685 TaxID=2866581 RepID=UPI001CE4471A|nr:substrate-binding domain-containing protein [Inquilinus sp. Marseille-Q2685]
MNIPDLEAFVAVVETGSIVGASARLNLPDGEVRGEFRLGVMPYLSEAALSVPLDRLRAEFPQLTLRVTSGWSVRLVDQVTRSELDAAALCLPDGISPPEDLVGEDLGTQRVLLVAAPSLGVPKPASLAELSRFPWIMNESGCGFRAYLRQRFEAERLPFQVAIEALSADLRMSLVARGLGIGILTPSAFADSRWRDAVEVVEAVDFQPRVRAWMLHRPPAGRLAQPIAAFRDGLAQALALPGPFLA